MRSSWPTGRHLSSQDEVADDELTHALASQDQESCPAEPDPDCEPTELRAE